MNKKDGDNSHLKNLFLIKKKGKNGKRFVTRRLTRERY